MIFLLFERLKGRAALVKLWEREHFSLPLAYVQDLRNFFSLRFSERLLQALIDETGDAEFARKAGMLTASPEAIGFAYYMLKAVGSPRLAYVKAIASAGTFNRIGRFEIANLTDRSMSLAYVSQIREQSRNICEVRMGQFASFPLIWGLPPAEVVETGCQALGAPRCQYELRWQNPEPSWRRHLGVLAGLAAGGAASALCHRLNLDTAGGLAVAGGALGALWDTQRVLSRRESQLRAHDEGLDHSLRELREQNDQLQSARHALESINRTLEQRVTDRTAELSTAKADLETALASARELDRLKTQFFDNISHELRTPLSLVILSLEYTLKLPDLPESVRRYLETMDRAADRLLRLINRLLDLAKLEAGQTKLRYAPVQLKAMVESMLPPFRVLAQSKGVPLAIEGPEPAEVHVDREMMEGIFQNLLGNALKFTAHGQVTVRFSETADRVLVEFLDTGGGIPETDLPLIFDRFAQSDSAGVRRFEGSGIGLALVKEGVEIHGGRIQVKSQVGQGTTFRVSLPKGTSHIREDLRDSGIADLGTRRRASPPQPPRHTGFAQLGRLPSASHPTPLPLAAPAAGAEARLVLLVEDDTETRTFLAAILRQTYRVVEAVNGREGLARMREEKPEVVVSDVMMPEMSGLQMVQAARADPALSEIPIVLLTARREVEDTLDGLSVGANDYLGKPFSPRELLARLDVQIRLRDASARLAASERLATLGILTSGFAHEVRNPLNGLLNALGPLQDLASEGLPADQALLDLALACGNRIQDLSNSLLLLTRPESQLDSFEASSLLEQTLNVLSWKVPKTLVIERDYGFQGSILGEPGPLGQVFMNLIDNALRAMAPTGTLRLSTAVVDGYLRIRVQDNGVGIRPTDLKRLFEPFFTTRPSGEGTGLGLALCRGIVERHQGRIEASSTLGVGTSFDVILPLDLHASEHRPAAQAIAG